MRVLKTEEIQFVSGGMGGGEGSGDGSAAKPEVEEVLVTAKRVTTTIPAYYIDAIRPVGPGANSLPGGGRIFKILQTAAQLLGKEA